MADASVKRCCTCKETKSSDLFPKSRSEKDGLKKRCKQCHNEKNREYRLRNPETSRLSTENWRKKNPEKARAKVLRFLARQPADYLAKKMAESRARNVERAKQKERELRKKRLANPSYRLHNTIGNGLRDNLRNKRTGSRTFDILGYSLEELKAHIERQFVAGMDWSNFGAWHIDHIQPLSSFVIRDQDDPAVRVAWGLPNLRPIWAKENLRKNAKRLYLV